MEVIKGWKDERMDGWNDGRMEVMKGWKHEWMEGRSKNGRLEGLKGG
jgi:hypothetical protein